MIDVTIADSYEMMSRLAADALSQQVNEKPSCVLGLATGSTPLGTYACLVEDAKRGEVDLSQVTTFNLDEYRGLPDMHEQSYRYYMTKNLYEPLGLDLSHLHMPNASSPNPDTACEAYERAIQEAGGIDLQLLGIGRNGHIGFNEPSESFSLATHIVTLTDSTIQANSRLFDSDKDVPREAMTMGIGTIMGARRIVLIASGADKAEIVAQTLSGPVTPQVPASILQQHGNVTIIVDQEAAKCL